MPAQKNTTMEPHQRDVQEVAPEAAGPGIEEILEENEKDSPLERKNTVLFGIGLVATALIIIIVLVVSLVYLKSSQTTSTKKETVSAAPTATPTPAFVPVTFAVLNASGVKGAAGNAAQQLTGRGYMVLSVGNTKQSAETMLYLASSLAPAVQAQVLMDASTLFNIATSSGDVIGSTAGAELVVGVK